MTAVYVEITATRGSAPRDAGTAMQVTARTTDGTIGGGALEHQAIRIARRMLDTGAADATRTFPLGPGLGQCCGGSVDLLFTRKPRLIDVEASELQRLTMPRADPVQLWLWGAGHVGRAVHAACYPQDFAVTWVDDAIDRFPPAARDMPGIVVAADMPLLARRAPVEAHHLIFTYAHDIDLALCAALLRRSAAFVGLIGSDTKWTRFSRRLRDMGLDPAPITCPIGDKTLGKRPADIARGAIRQLDDRLMEKTPA